ncbi:MAG TPA: hypothetical protein VFM09_05050 [Marmoricola sp.]|nr:hypothetical protein [Marmoricola sp.]
MVSDFDPDHEAERLRTAIDSVKGELRGVPHAKAIERLQDALRRNNAFVPEETVVRLARLMSDPWWPVRHPLQALRPHAHRGAPHVDDERYARQAEELSIRLERILESEPLDSYAISSRRTVDGMTHVVEIRPWSDPLAERIRAGAAPIAVTVQPFER